MLLITVAASGAFALEGVWGLRTELVQAIADGTVLGFANPDDANKVTVISFLPENKAEIAYGRIVYEVSWKQEGNSILFTLSESLPPFTLTMLAAGEDTFRYSYCLVDAKENLRPAGGSDAFVNYIGTMKQLGSTAGASR